MNKTNSINTPWILSIDNILVEIVIKLQTNQLLLDCGLVPGQNHTENNSLFTEKISNFSQESKIISGPAMNASRAANFYLQACLNSQADGRVRTLGALGNDESGNWIIS